ncbi:chemotaxis protein [Ideonella paludis]|uniref:Chemotaxis protein n=2 Tax=Ideonella paludis TaxID=1233411 RepID=A0ABS5DT81_9BURK|nr:chemotaxis protein [Ideonella paludis]
MDATNTPTRISARADRLMSLALLVSTVIAVATGWHFNQVNLALMVGLPLLVVGLGIARLFPGSLASRLTLAATLMGSVALHIQLARGIVEFHFGVFVVLAFLLSYRDWRPLLLGAGLVAVHHIAFDRLQAAGYGTYCLTEPDFARVLAHAGYVVAQTAFEIYMAVLLRRDANQGDELSLLVSKVQTDAHISLDVRDIDTSTRAATALKQALLQLHGSMAAVHQTIGSIQSASAEIAGGNADLSHRTEQAAGHLQQTSSSVVELTSTVKQTAESARTANDLAASAAQVAERGGEVVAAVVSTMQDIQQSSRKIGDIIGVIDGIAFQTNILALNAAVEAARAGEQGRGFAVVAGEVRSLAQRSAEAAREIKSLISASVDKVESGTRLVQDAGTTMTDIVGSVQRVSHIISEITAATGEQRDGLVLVNDAVHQLDAVTQQNAALVEQSAAAAESLKSQANQLAQAVSSIRI